MGSRRSVIRCMRGVDVLLTAAAFVLAYFIKKHLLPGPLQGLSREPNYYAVLLLVIIVWYIAFNVVWVYKDLRRQGLFQAGVDVVKANALGLLVLGFIQFAAKADVSRLLFAVFCSLDVVLLIAFRAALLAVMRQMDSSEANYRNVVIIGSYDRAVEVIVAIENHHANNVHILGCFDVHPELVGRKVVGSHRVIGVTEDLGHFLTEHVVDELIVAMPLKKLPHGDKCLAMAEDMGITARIVPDWQLHHLAYQPHVANINVASFSGVQTLTLSSTPKSEGKLFIKALFDHLTAFFLLLIALPLFIVFGLLIKLFSRGPVFYRQKRLGQNGRVFEILKFRTMVEGADQMIQELKDRNESDGPTFKLRKDPRIIPVVGTFLRKTSLDELPQLVNVLKGEMSLVGPRPPIPSEVGEYEIWHRRRLSMKPGITCFWQVAPCRNDLSFRQWVEMDLAYIDNWSLRTDMLILFKTLRAVLMGAGR